MVKFIFVELLHKSNPNKIHWKIKQVSIEIVCELNEEAAFEIGKCGTFQGQHLLFSRQPTHTHITFKWFTKCKYAKYPFKCLFDLAGWLLFSFIFTARKRKIPATPEKMEKEGAYTYLMSTCMVLFVSKLEILWKCDSHCVDALRSTKARQC